MTAVNPVWRALTAATREFPERPFLLADDEIGWWTYGRTGTVVEARMEALRQAGVASGDRVGIALGHPREFVLMWLSVLAMDAVAVPVDPGAPAGDRHRTLEKAAARFMVQDDDVAVPVTVSDLRWTGDRLVVRREGIGPRLSRPHDGGGLILLTSGTTGDPKPVGLSLAGLAATARNVATAHRITEQDVGYSPLPLFHINGEVVGVLSHLLAGASVIVSDRFHARRFWAVANREHVTWLNLVPSILKVLVTMEGGPGDPHRIRFIRSASAPLPVATLTALERRFGIPVIETYGLSEAASQIAANPLDGRRPGSVGKAVGVAIRVVDESGRAVVGAVGEVEVRGRAVLDPRWGPNRWAAEKMHQGWYRTGDLGFVDEDGYLYLRGRIRELINRGGEKIFPREVEEVILTHDEVSDCAVVGRPHPVLGEEPVAFLVLRGDKEEMPPDLDDLVASKLSRFKRPAAYFVVTSLPKGATGKVSRQSLRQRAMGLLP